MPQLLLRNKPLGMKSSGVQWINDLKKIFVLAGLFCQFFPVERGSGIQASALSSIDILRFQNKAIAKDSQAGEVKALMPDPRPAFNSLQTPSLQAQFFRGPKPLPPLPPANNRYPSFEPLLPSSEQLLRPALPQPPVPEIAPDNSSVTIVVKKFKVIGSTVFSEQKLAEALVSFTNRPLSLEELLQARSAITQLYINAGYVTSGAYIPPQEPQGNVIIIQILEGRVEDIKVLGNHRLNSNYVRSRLAIGTRTPLNINLLVEKLRLLKLDPLIENISAELASGLQPGTSILTVKVNEAQTFGLDIGTNNDRISSIGSWERWLELQQANLLGFGDGVTIDYINTDGSNEVDAKYTFPINPQNGTISLRYSFFDSTIIQPPFDVLDINSQIHYYDLIYRQPIIQTPTHELALSLTASHSESQSLFLEGILGSAIPFITPGSDENGQTNITALRFAQEWTQWGSRNIFSARSQFNVGLEPSGTKSIEGEPNGQFFYWLGQIQWVQQFAPDTLLLLRGEAQIANTSLNPIEQFGLGGRYTVRGYPQYLLLTDNGLLANAEFRFPIYRDRDLNGLLQGILFVDAGNGWNVKLPNPNPNTLVGTGLGLQWQMGDRFSADIFWGIPLIHVNYERNNLQESGIYFSIRLSPF